MVERYADGPPWIDGALDAVRATAALFTLGLASSSNRELIDLALAAGGIAPLFAATVSSEEVARGKPAPDVYLEAARRLGVDPAACVAIEDSHNGIRSAKAAGHERASPIPNAIFPPGDAVEEADVVLGLAGGADAPVLGRAPPAGSFLEASGSGRPGRCSRLDRHRPGDGVAGGMHRPGVRRRQRAGVAGDPHAARRRYCR